MLYEALNVSEYWIVDVENVEVIAFAVADAGSRRINQSQLLANFAISLLEEALQRTRQTKQGQVDPWLLNQFQQILHKLNNYHCIKLLKLRRRGCLPLKTLIIFK